jgi:hypothetical protein
MSKEGWQVGGKGRVYVTRTHERGAMAGGRGLL